MKIRSIQISILILVLAISGAGLQAQPQLGASQWQEDLAYMKNLIHQRYSNLFHTVTAAEFDGAVAQLHQEIPTLKPHQIMVGLSKIISMFRIGHTVLPLRGGHFGNNTGFHTLPISIYRYSDGYYIRAAATEYADAVGGKILKIGNMDIEAAAMAVRPVVPFENEQGFLWQLPNFINCPEILQACGVINEMSVVPLEIEKKGKTMRVDVKAEAFRHIPTAFGIPTQAGGWTDARRSDLPAPLYQQRLDRNYFYKYLPESKTLYVRHSQVRDEADQSIEAFFGEVFQYVDNNDVERFILDVRLNSGGNNYLNKPIITGLIAARKINQKGRLFTIIGRRTYSACQNLVNELEKYTETIFVGEPTAENVNFFGDTRQETLPNSGLNMQLSWLWWQNHDPRDTRPWIAPQIAVDLSFADYRDNKDPVMAAIMSYADQPPIAELLRQLYQQEKYEAARAAAQAYRDNPQNRFYNLEDEINRLGYQLMGANNLPAAREAFRLNLALYPASANAHDSLGEALWKSGDIPEAIKWYKKALAMDPEGPVGRNATEMLKRIQAEAASR